MRMIAMLAASAALTCMSLAPLPALADTGDDPNYPIHRKFELEVGSLKLKLSIMESEALNPVYIVTSDMAPGLAASGESVKDALMDFGLVVFSADLKLTPQEVSDMNDIWMESRVFGVVEEVSVATKETPATLKLRALEGMTFQLADWLAEQAGTRYIPETTAFMLVAPTGKPGVSMVLDFLEDEDDGGGYRPNH